MPNANGNTDPRDEIPPEIAQQIVNDATQVIGQVQAIADYRMTGPEREMFAAGVGAGMAASVVVLQRLGLLRPWDEATS